MLLQRRNPYEWLYERQSQPLKDYVLDEIAASLAKAAEAFPPAIEEWESEPVRLRWSAVVEQAPGPLPPRVVRLALKLFRWELERDVEAIDVYLTRGHFEALGTFTALEQDTALFLWRYWVDQTLAFKEYARDKFLWRDLLGLADRLDARWR